MPYTPNDFHSDLRQSEVFAAFLDKYFYRPMEKLIEEPCPEATPVWFERVWGMGPQMRGTDVILHEGPWSITIDEKAQQTYKGKLRETFVLELSYMKNGIPCAGWLVDPRKTTTAYLFCWPKGPADKPDVYTGASLALVYSNDIIAFLNSKGYTREVLCLREQFIRENGLRGRLESNCPDFWFAFSPHLKEMPVNVVVKEDSLKKLARAVIDVEVDEKSGVSRLSGNWQQQILDAEVPALQSAG